MTLTVADLAGAVLARLGVGHAFGVVGSGNFHLTNALRAEGVEFVAARHEGGAASMADGFSRLSPLPAVVTTHQGCGLTNAMTGITEAAKSRTPMLVLTADTAAAAIRSNFRIDQDALVASVGAVPERVHSADSAVADLVRAYRTAVHGRRTVVISLPLDVQAAPAQPVPATVRSTPGTVRSTPGTVRSTPGTVRSTPATVRRVPAPGAERSVAEAGAVRSTAEAVQIPELAWPVPVRPGAAAVAALAEVLERASRPVFVAGRGARAAGPQIATLASRVGALLATSAVANGLFEGEEYGLGISGGFSSPLTAELIAGADVIVGWGCALNMWTMRHGTLIAEGATVVQVDDDESALGAHRPISLGVHGDTATTAEDVLTLLGEGAQQGYRTPEIAARLATARWWNQTTTPDLSTADSIDPRVLSAELDRILPAQRVVSVDSGNFMGYPSAYLRVPDEFGFCFTQAFQSIGLGLASGIGAALAQPDRLPIIATGDGGFLMAISELETAVRLARPLLIVVYNDAAYGAEVHHFDTADLSTVTFPDVDMAAIARGYGAHAITVRRRADLTAVAEWARDPSGVMVLDAKIASDGGSWWLAEAFKGH